MTIQPPSAAGGRENSTYNLDGGLALKPVISWGHSWLTSLNTYCVGLSFTDVNSFIIKAVLLSPCFVLQLILKVRKLKLRDVTSLPPGETAGRREVAFTPRLSGPQSTLSSRDSSSHRYRVLLTVGTKGNWKVNVTYTE